MHRSDIVVTHQKAKLLAAAEALHNKLKRLDFPTFGNPTNPIFRLLRTRPNRTTAFFSSFALGGILSNPY
jgi:hypothetical protein